MTISIERHYRKDANNKLDEITDNVIMEIVTQGEVIKEEEDEEGEASLDDKKNFVPNSQRFKMIEAAL